MEDFIEINGKQYGTKNSLGKPIANTPEGIENFWKWFGASGAVDKQKRPLVLYHGTASNFSVFDGDKANSKSKTGAPKNAIFFTDDPRVASSYTVEWQGDFSARHHENANVMPVYLKMIKPLKVNAKGETWQEFEYNGDWIDTNTLAEIVINAGKKDSIIISKVKDKGVGHVENYKGSNTYIVFDPTAIKSAIGNSGEFNPSSKDITENVLSFREFLTNYR